jgi:hypothetical protein
MHPSQSSATSFICQHPRDTAGPELSATAPQPSGLPWRLHDGRCSHPRDTAGPELSATEPHPSGPLLLQHGKYSPPQGGSCDRSHCSKARWPLAAAYMQLHYSSNGHGGSWSRSHCRIAKWPALAAAKHVSYFIPRTRRVLSSQPLKHCQVASFRGSVARMSVPRTRRWNTTRVGREISWIPWLPGLLRTTDLFSLVQ